MATSEPASTSDQLTGEAYQKQLKVGKMLFAVAVAPLIMQVSMAIYLFFYPPGSGGNTAHINPHSRSVAFSGLGSAFGTGPAGQGNAEEVEEAIAASCVIGFADLHGDLQKAHAVLQASGASNETHLWAAGSCILVQTGDLVDRGPKSVDVTKLFEDIKIQAAAAGGKVVTLLGNHELMNLQGDFRYIAQDELRQLGDSGLRTATLEELLAAVPTNYRSSVAEYKGSDLLPGAAVWGQLMGPHGWFGQAMRGKLAATVQGSGVCRTLFVHAGMLPAMLEAVDDEKFSGLGKTSIERLNGAFSEALSTCDGAHACPKEGTVGVIRAGLGDQGPFWTRDYAFSNESELCKKVGKVLEAVGANRVVVGHTVQDNIRSRCDGKVLLMDVGMTRWIRGKNLAAFKCTDGDIQLVDQ